jgi:hypothetical protein
MARQKKTHDPFRWFDSSPEVIRLVVMMYVRYPEIGRLSDLWGEVEASLAQHHHWFELNEVERRALPEAQARYATRSGLGNWLRNAVLWPRSYPQRQRQVPPEWR